MQHAKITVRRSLERGHADHGWLNTYHTFSFASYADGNFKGFRSLRVLNEDRVAPGEGFGTHGHSNFEIFSYVINGCLEHKDSLSNVEMLKRGDVQFTSAGTGMRHSEFNGSSTDSVHFLQMWVNPSTRDLPPDYQTRHFSDEDKLNQLCLIVAPKTAEVQKHVGINQDASVYASLLEKDKEMEFKCDPARVYYVHVCDTGGKMLMNDVSLESGDGAFVEQTDQLRFTGKSDTPAEFLLFDLA